MRLPVQREQLVEEDGIRTFPWSHGQGCLWGFIMWQKCHNRSKGSENLQVEATYLLLGTPAVQEENGKKFIKPDAQDCWLGFEEFDMLPKEMEAVEETEKELKSAREATGIRKKKNKKTSSGLEGAS